MALGQAAGTAAHLARKSGNEIRQVSIADLQRQLLNQGQVLVYYRDLPPDHPGFRAMQYLGVRGFFPLWEAEPDRPVLRGEALSWFEKLEIKIWDRSRPLETLDWNVLERWLDTTLSQGAHPYVLRQELARVLFERVLTD
jgi:hypothetical protein